jgi:predicted transcriptional regulator
MSSSSPSAGERRAGEVVIGESSTESEPQPEDALPTNSTLEEELGALDQEGLSPASGMSRGEPYVSLTLSRNQVDHVVRAALGEGAAPSVPTLVASTGFHSSHARQMLSSRYRALQDNRRLSRSLLAGLLVLSCFPPEGVDLGIKDISEQLNLNTSTVHRYVLTLVAAGLLERDPDTRRYRLLPE